MWMLRAYEVLYVLIPLVVVLVITGLITEPEKFTKWESLKIILAGLSLSIMLARERIHSKIIKRPKKISIVSGLQEKVNNESKRLKKEKNAFITDIVELSDGKFMIVYY